MFKEFHCIRVAVEYFDTVRSIVARYANEDYPVKHKRGEDYVCILAKYSERKWKKALHDLMLLDEWHEDLFLKIDY